MGYCTADEVTALTGTELNSTIVDAIIAEADREINAKLALANLSGSGDVIKSASIKLSMAGVYRRHQMDGTQPNSLSVGPMSMSVNVDAAIMSLTNEADKLISNFIDASLKSRAWQNMVRKVNRC